MVWIVAVVCFIGVGVVGLHRRRAMYRNAMMADGFAPHEAKKALRILDRRGLGAMSVYCREVVERHERDRIRGLDAPVATIRDWSKADSYT